MSRKGKATEFLILNEIHILFVAGEQEELTVFFHPLAVPWCGASLGQPPSLGTSKGADVPGDTHVHSAHGSSSQNLLSSLSLKPSVSSWEQERFFFPLQMQ